MKEQLEDLIGGFAHLVHCGGMLSMTEEERITDNAKDVTIIHLEKQLEFIDEMENEINGDCGIYMTNYFDMKRKEIDKLIEVVRNY